MIRALIEQTFDSTKKYLVLFGLSTDSKPVSGLITGSEFHEVDTGVKYEFDEVNSQWHEVGITEQEIKDEIDAWLDAHPEVTTTVQDGSITNAKLASSFVTPGTAAAYSSSATYAVGDYCFHNGSLYRCTTAITTAEAWTAGHWTAVALGDDVSDLKSALTNVDNIGNANLIRESLPDYYFSAPTWVNAETAADMTDPTKSYLYLGSETGYTNGAIYTYNNDDSEWQTDENASYNVDEYLNQKIKDIPGTPSCIFFTDIHWRSQPDQHLPEIVQYLLAKIGRKPVIFGGDSVVAEPNKYMGYKELRRFTDKMKDSFGDVYYPVIGDHDNNAVGAYTPEELAIQEIPFVKCYEGAFGVMPAGITAISADTLDGITLTDAQYAEAVAYLKMNYYFDDTEMQTRYIFITSGMEMGALKDAFGITNVSYQIYLVLNFLYDAVLNAPSGYNVVLTMHNLVEDDNTDPNDKQPAPPNWYLMMAIKMLYGRKNKANFVAGTGTVSNANLLAYFEPDSGKNYKIYHFDGENLPDIGHVVVLSGDVHYNSSLITSGSAIASLTAQVIQPGTEIDENQILMISTQTASYGSVTQSSLCYPMAQGTVTEQALDILSFTENAVNFTRVGAGYDRTFPYATPD